jgi:tRNA 2-thiouridine synthesizing protein B
MSVLHIINKSPHDRNSLDSCLRLALAGSGILLIEDGVYATRKNSSAAARVQEALENHPVYALQPDLQARGMSPESVIEGVELVDYDGFVKLATEYDKTQSWL